MGNNSIILTEDGKTSKEYFFEKGPIDAEVICEDIISITNFITKNRTTLEVLQDLNACISDIKEMNPLYEISNVSIDSSRILISFKKK